MGEDLDSIIPPAQKGYEILGDDLQYLELTLEPGQSVISESSALLYVTEHVHMDTQLGKVSGGFFRKLLSASKKDDSQNGLFLSSFINVSEKHEARIAFSAPFPGKILPLRLSKERAILCRQANYLCSDPNIEIEVVFMKKSSPALFCEQGFVLQRLSGDGNLFLHVGGALEHLELADGQGLRVEISCLVAVDESVSYQIEQVDGVRSTYFAGEGMVFANLRGPGEVFLQSAPFARRAGKITHALARRQD